MTSRAWDGKLPPSLCMFSECSWACVTFSNLYGTSRLRRYLKGDRWKRTSDRAWIIYYVVKPLRQRETGLRKCWSTMYCPSHKPVQCYNLCWRETINMWHGHNQSWQLLTHSEVTAGVEIMKCTCITTVYGRNIPQWNFAPVKEGQYDSFTLLPLFA